MGEPQVCPPGAQSVEAVIKRNILFFGFIQNKIDAKATLQAELQIKSFRWIKGRCLFN